MFIVCKTRKYGFKKFADCDSRKCAAWIMNNKNKIISIRKSFGFTFVNYVY